MESKSNMDVESLQKKDAHGRCLDRCLVFSVVVLFLGLAAVAAGGVLMVNNLQSKMQTQQAQPPLEMSKLVGSAYVNIFKMQNFAYLEDTSSLLQNRTLTFHKNNVGSSFVFNPVQHHLTVKESGSYFMYLELNLTCTTPSQTGLIRVQVSDILSCDVHLSHSTCSQHQPTAHRCWAVRPLGTNASLLFDMSLPHGLHSKWGLQLHGVSFGMFLVGQ